MSQIGTKLNSNITTSYIQAHILINYTCMWWISHILNLDNTNGDQNMSFNQNSTWIMNFKLIHAISKQFLTCMHISSFNSNKTNLTHALGHKQPLNTQDHTLISWIQESILTYKPNLWLILELDSKSPSLRHKLHNSLPLSLYQQALSPYLKVWSAKMNT